VFIGFWFTLFHSYVIFPPLSCIWQLHQFNCLTVSPFLSVVVLFGRYLYKPLLLSWIHLLICFSYRIHFHVQFCLAPILVEVGACHADPFSYILAPSLLIRFCSIKLTGFSVFFILGITTQSSNMLFLLLTFIAELMFSY